MNEFFQTSVFLGVFITLTAFGIGSFLKKRFKLAIFNPILIATAIVIIVLLVFKIDYNTYKAGANYISYLLTPATIALAVPLYEKLELLKKNFTAVILGILSGVLTSLCSVALLSFIFKLDNKEYVTFLPKSITTAIGIVVSEELGGYAAITVAVILITGVLGNMLAVTVCRVFKITEPIAKGIGIGSASHAIGTSKAMEIGEIEGAMSSLSIVISGILTVVLAPIFAQII